MRRQLIASLVMLIGITVVGGFIYPLVTTGLSQLFWKDKANGSLVYNHGTLVGSQLIGQSFDNSKIWFQPRPSDAGNGYDGADSGASNLGPSNPVLIQLVAQRAAAYRAFNDMPANAQVPVDAVTASGSGLDPDISIANALDQAPRVARARHLSLTTVLHLIDTHEQQRGFLTEPLINVLELNLALEAVK
jgi:potassium-transporting ATPase KdpC subunit